MRSGYLAKVLQEECQRFSLHPQTIQAMNIPNDSPSSNDDDVELKLDDASAVGFIEQQITDAMAREPGLEAGNAIKNHVIIAMSLGLVPLPLFDLALLSGNQVAMIAALAKIYDVPFEEHRAKSIVVSLLAALWCE
jgi:hypothetical protein